MYNYGDFVIRKKKYWCNVKQLAGSCLFWQNYKCIHRTNTYRLHQLSDLKNVPHSRPTTCKWIVLFCQIFPCNFASGFPIYLWLFYQTSRLYPKIHSTPSISMHRDTVDHTPDLKTLQTYHEAPCSKGVVCCNISYGLLVLHGKIPEKNHQIRSQLTFILRERLVCLFRSTALSPNLFQTWKFWYQKLSQI